MKLVGLAALVFGLSLGCSGLGAPTPAEIDTYLGFPLPEGATRVRSKHWINGMRDLGAEVRFEIPAADRAALQAELPCILEDHDGESQCVREAMRIRRSVVVAPHRDRLRVEVAYDWYDNCVFEGCDR